MFQTSNQVPDTKASGPQKLSLSSGSNGPLSLSFPDEAESSIVIEAAVSLAMSANTSGRIAVQCASWIDPTMLEHMSLWPVGIQRISSSTVRNMYHAMPEDPGLSYLLACWWLPDSQTVLAGAILRYLRPHRRSPSFSTVPK